MLPEPPTATTPTEQAIIAAYLSRHTTPARQAMRAKFEQAADPDGILSPADRARRVAELRREHFTRLGQISAAAKRARRQAEEDRRDGDTTDERHGKGAL